ncbi:ribosomal protein L7/L12 [Candidatus Gracilibacteria bacterium]|nr:ribosomal protein L7/L12 [Candidatus Gracilibacteria bacterium]
MKRLPALTALLRDKGVIARINEIMAKNPGITYDQVVETILDFDDANTECIARALANGDIEAETILNNYGRKCTNNIQAVGDSLSQETPEAPETTSNFVVQITEIAEGKQLDLEQKITELTSYDLIEAKTLLKNLPAIVEVGLEQTAADNLALELRNAGATVEVQSHS